VEGCSEYDNELSDSINIGELLSNCTIGGHSGRPQLHVISYKDIKSCIHYPNR
jgi:hypothetical protein